MSKQGPKRKREEPAKSAPKIRRLPLDSPKDAIADTEWQAANEDMFANPLDSSALRAGASVRSPIATRRRTTMFVSTSAASLRSVPASTLFDGKPDTESKQATSGVLQPLPKTGLIKDQAKKTKLHPASASLSNGGFERQAQHVAAGERRGPQGAARSKLTRLRRLPTATAAAAESLRESSSAARAEKPQTLQPHTASSSITGLAGIEAEQNLSEVVAVAPTLKAAEEKLATPASAPPKLLAASAAAAIAGGRPSRQRLRCGDVSLAREADVSIQPASAYATPPAAVAVRDRSATNVGVGAPADAVDGKSIRALPADEGQQSAADESEPPASAFYTPAAAAPDGHRKQQLAASQSVSEADATAPATKRVRGRPRKAHCEVSGELPAVDGPKQAASESLSVGKDDRTTPRSGEAAACQQVAAAVAGDAVPKEMPVAQASEPTPACESSSSYSDCNDPRSYRALAAYEAGDTHSTSKWCSVM